ncbi:MAG: HK97 family phage prohead protease [Rhodospirillales bacterium]|nr:HK97 family phage prohead protease [Rhodospirillales bacterium]
MSEIERRTAATEIRVAGRKLIGTAMTYGEVSPSHRERFEPGAFRMADTVILDVGHDRERAVAWTGAGLELADGDTALELAADLPPIPAADRALEEIRAGTTTGLSVEFRSRKERRDGDVRVIEEADLLGVGIVAHPSYEGARVEARERKRRHKAWL